VNVAATGHQAAIAVGRVSAFEQEGRTMRSRWKIAAFVVAGLAAAPSVAQQAGGVATETQDREASHSDNNILWNIVGLIGLLGLRGLWRDSDNDGYTDDPV
jgi:hypothetical protein